jgi:hypothetical protein
VPEAGSAGERPDRNNQPETHPDDGPGIAINAPQNRAPEEHLLMCLAGREPVQTMDGYVAAIWHYNGSLRNI